MSYIKIFFSSLFLLLSVLSATKPDITGNWKLGTHHVVVITDSTLHVIEDGDTTTNTYKRVNSKTITIINNDLQFSIEKRGSNLILKNKDNTLFLVDTSYDFNNKASRQKEFSLTGSWIVSKITGTNSGGRDVSHIRFHENRTIEFFSNGYSKGREEYLIADNILLFGYNAENALEIETLTNSKIVLNSLNRSQGVKLKRGDFISNDLLDQKSGYSTAMRLRPTTPQKSKAEFMKDLKKELKKSRSKSLPKKLKKLEGIWVRDPQHPLKSDKKSFIHITPFEVIRGYGNEIDSTPYEIIKGDSIYMKQWINPKMQFQLDDNRLTLIDDMHISTYIRRGTNPPILKQTVKTMDEVEGQWIITKVIKRNESSISPLADGDTVVYSFDSTIQCFYNGALQATAQPFYHRKFLWMNGEGPFKLEITGTDSLSLYDLISGLKIYLKRRI